MKYEKGIAQDQTQRHRILRCLVHLFVDVLKKMEIRIR